LAALAKMRAGLRAGWCWSVRHGGTAPSPAMSRVAHIRRARQRRPCAADSERRLLAGTVLRATPSTVSDMCAARLTDVRVLLKALIEPLPPLPDVGVSFVCAFCVNPAS
jgi:hypothetical protein